MGTATIGKLTPWGYAEFTQVLESTSAHPTTLVHEGIAFADEEKTIYALARERNNDYPRFFVFHDCVRPDGGEIKAIYGTVLGGARLSKRLLSPVVLYRGDTPRPEGPVYISDMSALPDGVRIHLKGGDH